MSTHSVGTLITRARFLVQDTGSLVFTANESLVDLLNDYLDDVYSTLTSMESNYAYAEGSIALSDGTGEYSASFTHSGLLEDGVWLKSTGGYYETTYLFQVSESLKNQYGYDNTGSESEPEAYYITEDNKIGFLPVPNTVYTVSAQYWSPPTAFTATTSITPYEGVFDAYFVRRLVVDLLEIRERDNSRQALMAQREWDKAMAKVYRKGLRQRRNVSDLFTTIPGI